jgi:type III pantothenate kinase
VTAAAPEEAPVEAPMLLVIDAGNTNVVFAVWDGARWSGTWRIRTDPQRTSD